MEDHDVDEILFDCEERMEKAVNVFRDELRGLRTGRATPALVDTIRVEYYGSPTPLKQLAQISTPGPAADRHPAVRRRQLEGHREGHPLQRSGHVAQQRRQDDPPAVPAMSGEQRQKMVARIKKSAEDAKVACRNIRRDANKHFDTAEKNKEMTEDERDKGKEEVQTLLKRYEDKIGELADKKTKEVMEQ